MTARDDILGRVRSALQQAPRPPVVPREYRAARGDGDLLDLFAERVSDYRAQVVRCSADDVEARIAEQLGSATTIVPADLPWAVPGAVVDVGQNAGELDRLDAVVTATAVAIARTGTVVLDHGPGQGRRALSLIPDLHVCVVTAGQVVYGVPEAVLRLDPRLPQTWISGPSATSDIELSRVEGVHGPRQLTVVLVAD